jgi:hypothetical protein
MCSRTGRNTSLKSRLTCKSPKAPSSTAPWGLHNFWIPRALSITFPRRRLSAVFFICHLKSKGKRNEKHTNEWKKTEKRRRSHVVKQ